MPSFGNSSEVMMNILRNMLIVAILLSPMPTLAGDPWPDINTKMELIRQCKEKAKASYGGSYTTNLGETVDRDFSVGGGDNIPFCYKYDGTETKYGKNKCFSVPADITTNRGQVDYHVDYYWIHCVYSDGGLVGIKLEPQRQ